MVVIYAVLMYVFYIKKIFVFEPFVPTIPANSCQPLINVIQLTPDQVAKRANILRKVPKKGVGR